MGFVFHFLSQKRTSCWKLEEPSGDALHSQEEVEATEQPFADRETGIEKARERKREREREREREKERKRAS